MDFHMITLNTGSSKPACVTAEAIIKNVMYHHSTKRACFEQISNLNWRNEKYDILFGTESES